MKKLFFAMMIAAAGIMASCNPDNTEEPGNDTPFYGLMMHKADVVNLGDFADNGCTQYLVQMATLNDTGGYSNMLSVYFETTEQITDINTIPEGTYSLLEGDYVNNSYFDGSIYMTTAKNEQNQLTANWTMITDGTIEIKKNQDGNYRLTVNANGYDYYTFEEAPEAECRYEGECNFISNRYNPDWAGALYYEPTDGGLPYWNLQLDDHWKYLLQFYVNTTNTSFEEGIPTGEYIIDDSMAPWHIDSSMNIGPDTYGGSVAYKIRDDETLEPHNLMIGGKVNINKTGQISTKKDDKGEEYHVCQYEIDVVFYNISYIPYVASFVGEVELYYQPAPEYEKYAYLMYYGNNKWCLMLGDEEQDICPVIYCFSDENTTFESGLSTGTYTVAPNGIPFQNVDSGEPFTILPGIVNNNKLVKESSAFWTYDCTQIWDALGYGTMDVVNNGDGNYKIDLNLGGLLGYVTFVYAHEGKMDVVSDNSGNKAPALNAASALRNNSPLRFNTNRSDNFQYYGPTLGR